MRSVVAALVLLFGVSAASAQYIPGAVEKWCKEAAEAKAKLTLLQNEYSLLTNSRDVLFFAGAEAKKAGNYDRYSELDRASDRQNERAYQLYREMVGLEATVAHFSKFCTDEVAQSSSVQPPQEKRTAPNGAVKRNTALIRDANRALAAAEGIIAASKQDLAAIERRYGIVLSAPYRPFAGVPYTFFADVTKLQAGDRAFPDFSQTYARDGNYNVNFGGTFDVPVNTGSSSLRFWLSLGWMLYYLNSSPTEVRNDNAPGVTRLTGTDDDVWGGAVLAGFGGRLLPPDSVFGGLEWQLLGGIGLASSRLRGTGPAGNELFNSREMVTALVARAALYYLATKNLKVGVVVGLIELERQTGTLSNLSNFAIGSATNTFVGASVAYTLD